jgi:NADPH2:quinone reductase
MKAMVRKAFGGPEQLVSKDVPIPTPASGEVLLRVRAFGINHAELYMRRGVWGDVSVISGIECAGQVEHDPSGVLVKGATVVTFMGGLGRTRPGSYAQYTTALARHVLPIATSLGWTDLAAIPEAYATAWSCLVDHLRLAHGETLVVRGGTSSVGLAAINVASELGAVVVATTRSRAKESVLRAAGATDVLIEDVDLSKQLRERRHEGADCVLDLVGNRTVLDSTRMGQRGSRVCVAGFLGGPEPVSLDVLSGLQPGVEVSFFASFLYGTKGYPVSKIPMQTLVNRATRGLYSAKPVRVFPLEELPEAHRLMESNAANGKIVVAVE